MGTKAILIICAVIGGFGHYAYSQRQQSLSEQAKANADRAVSILPEGIKDAWVSYVERRVASAIQYKAGAVVLRDDDLFGITFVSRNTPFKVTCDPITGGRVEFGYGEGSVGVQIFDFLAEKQPPLIVSKTSVAAADLSRELCERISQSVSQILQP